MWFFCFIYCLYHYFLYYYFTLSFVLGLGPITQFGPKEKPMFSSFLAQILGPTVGLIQAQRGPYSTCSKLKSVRLSLGLFSGQAQQPAACRPTDSFIPRKAYWPVLLQIATRPSSGSNLHAQVVIKLACQTVPSPLSHSCCLSFVMHSRALAHHASSIWLFFSMRERHQRTYSSQPFGQVRRPTSALA